MASQTSTRKDRITYYAKKIRMVEKRIAELEEEIPKEASIIRKINMQGILKTNKDVLKLVTDCFQAAIEENKS